MEFLDKKIEQYATLHSEPENEVLAELNRITHLKVNKARMLSGHLQGRTLSLLSKLVAPQCVLEIGTYTGYSAICLAEGLQKNGKLITIDINEELEELALTYFKKANLENQIELKIGKASSIIPTLSETFDLVFIDADKVSYSRYYDLVIDQVRSGGLIIVDNVLWSGKVVAENLKPKDKDTPALMEFNQKVHQDERVENLLLPIRDGLMLLRKR